MKEIKRINPRFCDEETSVMERIIVISLITDSGLLHPVVEEYYCLIDHNYSPDEAIDKIEKRYLNGILGYLK